MAFFRPEEGNTQVRCCIMNCEPTSMAAFQGCNVWHNIKLEPSIYTEADPLDVDCFLGVWATSCGARNDNHQPSYQPAVVEPKSNMDHDGDAWS